ncbi:ABC transporter ATP-binding protein [Kutzneria buriramensis]|uniref:ABC-type multidrug transport system ATPase subunit n=1 Tax=Kutzneria buriramensis TaxID=1045776 RepID=A0A3E0G6I1_9PSEU|nr:ABC transporter ATP-binding protein [Kutzneria buriramensis]REH18130.1 ABC-type multidrug transport system ATPase subunit [Kutzneria buriramensis]
MIIEMTGVGKRFRNQRRPALDDVDLTITPGMFGLLGANGAGKTTLMRLLAGVQRPTSGAIRVGPWDLARHADQRQFKQTLGYLPQDLRLYPDMTARGLLDYVAILKGISDRTRRRSRVESLLDTVALSAEADRKVGGFSGGMLRRVGIAQALLNDPSVLIVDEPTAGLDPEERLRFRNILSRLAGDRTIILSTHIVEDIAATCRQLAVLRQGRVAYFGDTAGLIDTARGKVWTVETNDLLPPETTVVSTMTLADTIRYRVVAGTRPHPGSTPTEPGLEDGYLALMQHQAATAVSTTGTHR